MIVRLIKKNKIYDFSLPNKVSGNYWIEDNDRYGNTRNLINVEADNGLWKIKSDFETKILSGNNIVESAYLKEYNVYFLKINTENEFVILYCSPSMDDKLSKLKVNRNGDFIIGSGNQTHITYSYPLVSKQHAKLTYKDSNWIIQDLHSKYGTYVNGHAVSNKTLSYGDIIFIMGLRIIVMKDYLVINNILNTISYDSNSFSLLDPIVQEFTMEDSSEDEVINFYKAEDYFFRSPRFKSKIEPANIVVEDPPAKETQEQMPAIYTIGPMITMAMSSVAMSFSSISGLINGTMQLNNAMPSLVMSFAMILTMLLWPLLSNKYQQKQRRKREKLRQDKYMEYVQEKHQDILSEMKIQRQILIDNYLPLDVVENIIRTKKRNLWEREIKQDDFLDLRLGIGSSELQGNIVFPEPKFELDEDNLKDLVLKVASESRVLTDVPISLSFVRNYISAIIGEGRGKQKFIEGLILQMIAFHSYEDLKIVLFTNENNESLWNYLKVLPHCFSNDKSTRFFATNQDERKELSLYLEKELQNRKAPDNNMNNTELSYYNFSPYYFIITDDYKSIRDLEIIKDVCSLETNLGFSFCIVSPRLTNLPNRCKTFISIGDKKSGVFENELVSNKQKEFIADINPNLDMYENCRLLSNIPIDLAREEKNLPETVTFLEMYNVGLIEQLNILNRWRHNDPTKSLQVPIGIDKNGEYFQLDLHEKYYGPHGLVAGMTGSGKSELLISYILSMAVNFHPYEVSFVLIDYKGGGLAGVFQNKETGMKLPHLAGAITNLDTIEMNRALASIQSELRRRQRMFNLARDNLNESTIDIYKYQRLYREGRVDTPISHLFIISDEFAELKSQQPDFMDQLISTARIGRSLGVHLILATQKPSGVVDDQIWSNSKFKICLKVQDNSDSMDMIRRPDAAALKNPGRFYLQVGYNELFALGQSAWCGAQYYPTEKRKKKIDNDVDFIDNVGNVIKSMDTSNNKVKIQAEGEELSGIVKYVVDTAKKENISIPQLWLDRIPDFIYIEDLKKKYNYTTSSNDVELVIGEYDDPDNQKQFLLNLSLMTDGNTIIYGSTGSGKEILLSSIIYSAITSYNPDEVNFYILDFGAETLRMFSNAPQVGNVLSQGDTEQTENLFKMLASILEERKKLFADYNGSYSFFKEHSNKNIPLITIIINNYEGFIETYEDYEDILLQLTREGSKYGIVFILTSNSTNAIRYRMKQNFKNNLCLQFNDSSDYSDVLSNVGKKIPSKVFGRGLVELDNVYEFQTAYAYRSEKLSDYIKVISSRLKDICKTKAMKIPVLPDIVSISDVEESLGNLSTVPIGIAKDDLSISTFDFDSNKVSLITALDIYNFRKFYKSLINIIAKISYKKVIVIDAAKLFKTNDISQNYYNNNFDDIISKINNSYVKYKAIYEANNYDEKALENNEKITYFIFGLSNLFTRIDDSNKETFENAISDSKNYGLDNYIIIDSSDKIKGFAYDAWYKESVDDSQGIWLGNGISDQYTLKLLSTPRELREEIPEGFGYVVKNGKATLVKLVQK